MFMRNNISVASVDLPPLTVAQFVRKILDWASESEKKPRLVTYLNAHNVNLAFEDAEYADILQRADLLYADGMGVVWAWRRLGRPLPERVNAGDFMEDLCKAAAERNLSIYCLGSFSGVAEQAARAWQKSVPALKIAGTHDGFFAPENEEALAEEIRRAKPSILLVGMSVPLQEKWAMRWKNRLDVPVIWCVGALFEYWGMKRSRAPVWMRKAGLEWLWRLALEPRRMARRYILGNLKFLRHVWRMKRNSG